ncbi:MAG: hypothetical protein ABIT37_02485 [Luteolibacter sp.]
MQFSVLALLGLSAADLAVIAAYFVVMILIGLRSLRRIHTEEEFFLGKRRFGKFIQMFANFGQATSVDTGPTVITTTYHNGLAGVWSVLMLLFGTPFHWFTSVWYRRMRTATLGDYYAERYHSRMIGGIYAMLMGIGLCILLSLSFIILVKTVQSMTPKDPAALTLVEQAEVERAGRLQDLGARDFQSLAATEQEELGRLEIERPRREISFINPSVLIWAMVVMICLCAVTGGLEAVLIGDVIQSLFILLLSVLLIPFAIATVNQRHGGSGLIDAFRTLHEQKSESFFHIFGSPAAAEFTWHYVAAIALMGLINSGAQANVFVAPRSARDEFSARFGMTSGIYLKRITTVLWGVTAMFIILLFAGDVTDPDLLWGHAAFRLLAPLGMGLVGIVIVASLAGLMATAEMFMITVSALVTRNIYRPLFPNCSERHYLNVGRIFGVAMLAGAALLSMASDSLLGTLKLWWEFGGSFAAAMWMGILWKRTSRLAVYLQISLSLLLFFVLPMGLPAAFPSLRSDPALTKTTLQRLLTTGYSSATEEDVKTRKAEILEFLKLPPDEQAGRTPPAPIHPAQPWTRTTILPARAIFWTGGLETVHEHGGTVRYRGKGRLNLSLLGLDRLGFDLTKNSYSLNETIRALIIIFFPFAILLIASPLMPRRPEEIAAAERMAARLLTPVDPDPETDARAAAEAHANPACRDHLKLFGPHSSWQFRKWTRIDTTGFILNLGAVGAILGALFFFAHLGS